MDLREGVKTLSMDGTTTRACLPGLGADDRRRVYYYALLPNLLLNLHPDYMLTFTLWPLAPDRTDVICEWHFHPDAIASPDFDPQGRHRVLGDHEQAGLGAVRAGPAGDRVPRLPAGAVLQPRGAAARAGRIRAGARRRYPPAGVTEKPDGLVGVT